MVRCHSRGWAAPALLFGLSLSVFACGGGGASKESPTPAPPQPDAILSLDLSPTTLQVAPVMNPRLLGSNLQWTSGGDGVLAQGTRSLEPGALKGAQALGPTVLRYPGGGLADTYHFQSGLGASRGTCLNVFSGAQESVEFGTDEFLALCDQLGAQPLLTLNLVTAQPAESVAWLTHVNGGRTPALQARDWELGNEPYLSNDSHPELNLSASQFAAAYDAHAAALLAEDPQLRLGLPLMGPATARLVGADRKTYTADVLAALHQRVDFVAVHNAYLPFLWQAPSAPPSTQDMLQAVLASAPSVGRDLDALRAQLNQAGIHAPFAMTEYSSLMSVGMGLPYDGVPVTLAGAFYAADLLGVLAQRNDMDSAEHWSLLGNWYFGSMYWGGAPRPVYRVFQGLKPVFQGRRLSLSIQGACVDVPAFGALQAQTAMPLVAAWGSVAPDAVRVVLLNRSPQQDLRVRLTGLTPQAGQARVRTLNASQPLQVHDGDGTVPDWVEASSMLQGGTLELILPAHAVVVLSLPPVS